MRLEAEEEIGTAYKVIEEVRGKEMAITEQL
jgi:hypothetical protein